MSESTRKQNSMTFDVSTVFFWSILNSASCQHQQKVNVSAVSRLKNKISMTKITLLILYTINIKILKSFIVNCVI